MNFLIYYWNERTHRPVSFLRVSDLEKFISEAEGCGLTFKDEPEAGAVFFSNARGQEIGFYMEAE